MKRVIVFFALIVFSYFGRSEAAVITLNFQNVTSNSAVNAGTGKSQLFLEAVEIYPNQVLFTFKNTGTNACAISEIYFDDDSQSLLGISSIVDSPQNVIFKQGASPGELPGANFAVPRFNTTEGFLAQASSPANKKRSKSRRTSRDRI